MTLMKYVFKPYMSNQVAGHSSFHQRHPNSWKPKTTRRRTVQKERRQLQKIHLVIKDKKGVTSKVVDILSRSSLNALVVLHNSSLKHESYVEQYSTDDDFEDIYESLTHGTQIEEKNYHIYDKLLYYLGNLCIPHTEKTQVI